MPIQRDFYVELLEIADRLDLYRREAESSDIKTPLDQLEKATEPKMRMLDAPYSFAIRRIFLVLLKLVSAI